MSARADTNCHDILNFVSATRTDPSGQNWSDTLCRRRHVATCRRHFQLSCRLQKYFLGGLPALPKKIPKSRCLGRAAPNQPKGVDYATPMNLYNLIFQMVILIPFLTQPPHERTLTGRGSRVYPNVGAAGCTLKVGAAGCTLTSGQSGVP
jgi:hypothetical protein